MLPNGRENRPVSRRTQRNKNPLLILRTNGLRIKEPYSQDINVLVAVTYKINYFVSKIINVYAFSNIQKRYHFLDTGNEISHISIVVVWSAHRLMNFLIFPFLINGASCETRCPNSSVMKCEFSPPSI